MNPSKFLLMLFLHPNMPDMSFLFSHKIPRSVSVGELPLSFPRASMFALAPVNEKIPVL